MNKKQFALLFVAIVFTWTVGAGLTPLLPLHALDLGGTPAVAGYTLAFAWLTLSIGGLVGGRLSDSTGRRKPGMLVASGVFLVALWGMASARNVYHSPS